MPPETNKFDRLSPGWRPVRNGIAIGLLISMTTWAQTSACDASGDGVVNVVDVTRVVNMVLGAAPCTVSITGSTCTVVTVQRVVNAALGQPCVTDGASRTVTLNWVISASPNISGHNVYRSSTSGGPYTKVNTSLVTNTSYMDSGVAGGQTLYYVVTAVNSAGLESTYSNQATAVIPN